ncbi:MAG: hypothetical protein LBQ60_00935 [Bacteroidales bacterium]|nr:hypothetical protein [Bacteroidales bacterium]
MTYLAFLPLLSFLFVVQIYAREIKIEGQIVDPIYPYLTLINPSDNSVVWKGEAEKRTDNPRFSTGRFSFSAPEGEYILCIHNMLGDRTTYLLIDLDSDMDLGEIKQEELPYFSVMDGYDYEDQGGISRFVILEPNRKELDVLALLNYLSITDFRINREQVVTGTVEIDGSPLKGNLWEQIQYLRKMSTENVEYIEKIPETESRPGGIIRIVTTAYQRSVERHPDSGQINIRGTIDLHPKAYPVLVKLSDNSIVWRGRVSKGRQFSINIEHGDYVFCISFGLYTTDYIPVEAETSIDLGIVTRDTTLRYPKGFGEGIFHGREGKKYFPEERTKAYDMLLVLNSKNLFSGAEPPNALYMSTVQIDGVLVRGNLLEVVKKLRNTPATNVEYVDVTYPTEEYPGGLLNIVTSTNKDE